MAGHMAFATDPPYCVAYATDYKNNDPSKMTPHEPLNHAYAMITSNMVVKEAVVFTQLEPADRKHTKGGCLLIPRGMQFGSGLFPEIVIPHNHAGPLVNSTTHQEVPFWTIGPFWALDTIFPAFEGIWNCLLLRKWPSWRSWGFKPSQCTWAPAALSAACAIQSG